MLKGEGKLNSLVEFLKIEICFVIASELTTLREPTTGKYILKHNIKR